MTLRPGTTIQPDGKTCGAMPVLTERVQSGINILRVVCKCGNEGGSVFYRKPEDADRTKQAAVDGWNLSQ
jgi:hypothetical protein